MGDVKWIKLYTTLPDHRKIKQIRKLPDGDTIALMWVFLLCLAGETNDDGMVYITKEVPYTEETLSNQFDMDINTVRMGLQVFQQFGMIEIINDILLVSNWEKYQSVNKLDDIREYNRLAQQRCRAKKALTAATVDNVNDKVNDVSMTSQLCHEIDKDIDKEKEKELYISLERENEREKDPTYTQDVYTEDFDPAQFSLEELTPPTPQKEEKHKYGDYKNVLLTDAELAKLKQEFPDDWEERIERVSIYVASTGKTYKNYLATIRNWARDDKEKEAKKPAPKKHEYHNAPVEEGFTESFMADALAKQEEFLKRCKK